jgi:hypothetical protein
MPTNHSAPVRIQIAVRIFIKSEEEFIWFTIGSEYHAICQSKFPMVQPDAKDKA